MKLTVFIRQSKEKGQSLVEVTIALLVAIVVLGALAVLITSSLKNAQFAQKQVKATKYAQEAIDQIRVIRDRNENNAVRLVSQSYSFSELWSIHLSSLSPCISGQQGRYFTLDPATLTLTEICVLSEIDVSLGDSGILRQIMISDTDDAVTGFAVEKIVTVKSKWSDSSGNHESVLQTIVSKI